ncbi:DUF2934 domain-containing protein [Candidatus Accumulibacter vicinus]|nr:DUF2934 domain-containing protein [Candidatus Accumulibacter vicinus]
MLNDLPPLHDQFALGSIHFAGVMMLASIAVSCQKWPPAFSPFATGAKLAVECELCKRLSKSRISKNAGPTVMIDPENEPEAGDRLQRIATIAYYKAEARGFAPGLEMDDWLQAEAEVDTEAQQ